MSAQAVKNRSREKLCMSSSTDGVHFPLPCCPLSQSVSVRLGLSPSLSVVSSSAVSALWRMYSGSDRGRMQVANTFETVVDEISECWILQRSGNSFLVVQLFGDIFICGMGSLHHIYIDFVTFGYNLRILLSEVVRRIHAQQAETTKQNFESEKKLRVFREK